MSNRSRRLGRRRVLTYSAYATAGLALAACTAPATPVPATTVAGPAPTTAAAPGASPTRIATATPKVGGTLRPDASTSRPEHMDIHQTPSFHGPTSSIGLAYSRLLKFKAGPDADPGAMTVVGDLAESWDQPDELTYVFKLRGGVRFQNIPPVSGRELVASDILYSYERQRALTTNAAFLAAIGKIEAPDPRTVRLTLEKADPDFLINLANGRNAIVPKESVDVNGDLKQGPVIGSGPWIHREYRVDGDVLVRNPDYYRRGLPYVERLEFRRILDSATLLSAVRGKELDIQSIGITAKEAETLKREFPELQVLVSTSTLGSSWEMGIRADRPPLSDVRLRQAISKAIDRQQMIETLHAGKGQLVPGVTLMSPDWWLPADELRRLMQRDLNGARRLLGEAGAGGGLDITIAVPNFGETYISGAELIVAQLAEANIRAKLDVFPSAAYNARILTQGDFEVYFAPAQPAGSTNTDLLNRFHSKGARHVYKANDPTLDALIERQTTLAKDPAGRVRVLQEIQRRLIDQAWLLGILAPSSFTVAWPYVKDWGKGVAWGQAAEGDHLTTVWLDR